MLCYPKDKDKPVREADVYDYIRETAEQVEHYLGLSMNIIDVRLLPGLSAFAMKNAQTR